MFIFYYAVLSEVSPPTALSPFAAAALTDGNPFRTMMLTWKYTLPAFLVPFLFTLSPEGMGVLLQAPPADVVLPPSPPPPGWPPWPRAGRLAARGHPPGRALATAGALLFYASPLTDALGLALAVLGAGLHLLRLRLSPAEGDQGQGQGRRRLPLQEQLHHRQRHLRLVDRQLQGQGPRQARPRGQDHRPPPQGGGEVQEPEQAPAGSPALSPSLSLPISDVKYDIFTLGAPGSYVKSFIGRGRYSGWRGRHGAHLRLPGAAGRPKRPRGSGTASRPRCRDGCRGSASASSCRTRAGSLGLTGYVRNAPDGRRVEVVAEGPRDALRRLLEALLQGPPGAYVERVVPAWGPASGEFSAFTIRH